MRQELKDPLNNSWMQNETYKKEFYTYVKVFSLCFHELAHSI